MKSTYTKIALTFSLLLSIISSVYAQQDEKEYYKHLKEVYSEWLYENNYSPYFQVSKLENIGDTLQLDLIGTDSLKDCNRFNRVIQSTLRENSEILHRLLRKWAFIADINLDSTYTHIRIFSQSDTTCYIKIFYQYGIVSIERKGTIAMGDGSMPINEIKLNLIIHKDSTKTEETLANIKKFLTEKLKIYFSGRKIGWFDAAFHTYDSTKIEIAPTTRYSPNVLKLTVTNIKNEVLEGQDAHELIEIALKLALKDKNLVISCDIIGKYDRRVWRPKSLSYLAPKEDNDRYGEKIIGLIMDYLEKKQK